MRDILLFVLILGGIPWYVADPYFGILAYHFVGIMNPHRYSWGAAYFFPFAMYLAGATLLGLLFGKGKRNSLPVERETLLLLFFWLVITVSSLSSLAPDVSSVELTRTSKILFMTFLTMLFLCSREGLLHLFWVVALSLGLTGIKGCLFGVATGGGLKVFGPPDTFIYDNNDVGMAFNIALPVIYYLAVHAKTPRLRLFMLGTFILTAASTILTFSRGSAVSLAFTLFLFAACSQQRMKNIIWVGVLMFILSFLMTNEWTERMSTIDVADAQQDASFMGRVNAWHGAWNMAADRPFTGGGLGVTNSEEVFVRYAPNPENFHASHSIYFQVLGENGFVGFGLFAFLLISLQLRLNAVRLKFRNVLGSEWLSDYSFTIQLSLCAYMVNGLTLGRAYFDLSFLIMAAGIMVISLARREKITGGEVCVA